MATYDVTVGGTTGVPFNATGKLFVLKKQIDIEEVIAGNATLSTAAKIASGAYLQAIAVPAKTWVIGTGITVDTASTDTTLTVDVGWGESTYDEDLMDDINLATTTDMINEQDEAASLTATNGKYFAATDTIDVLFNNDATNGVFTLKLVCVDLS